MYCHRYLVVVIDSGDLREVDALFSFPANLFVIGPIQSLQSFSALFGVFVAAEVINVYEWSRI